MNDAELRFAIVGFGNIGKTHYATLSGPDVPRARVSAVVTSQSADLPEGVDVFPTVDALLAADAADVVVVATPTMDHEKTSLAALAHEHHLVVEKPMAMTVRGARHLVESRHSDTVAAVMLNQRYHGAYRRVREIVMSGELGELCRFSWIMTTWYRPNVYFAVSAWRGTWPGEGGGALMNQGIHNLDVLQWLLGLPSSVYAHARFGKYHAIDVEDEVTAILRYDNGMSGMLVLSTGEAPGVNRLEIVGDRGTLVLEGERIRVATTKERVSEHCAESLDMFGAPRFDERDVDNLAVGNQHAEVFNDVIAAIADSKRLATPLDEGLGSIELANAILWSAWEGRPVELPIDADAYDKALNARIDASGFRDPQDLGVTIDMESSYR